MYYPELNSQSMHELLELDQLLRHRQQCHSDGDFSESTVPEIQTRQTEEETVGSNCNYNIYDDIDFDGGAVDAIKRRIFEDKQVHTEVPDWQKRLMMLGVALSSLGMIAGAILIIMAYRTPPNLVMLAMSLPLMVVSSGVMYALFILHGYLEEENIQNMLIDQQLESEMSLQKPDPVLSPHSLSHISE